MKLVRDVQSFAEPLDRAIEEAVHAVIAAGNPVRGSENRVARMLQEKKDLESFIQATGRHLENRSFAGLPRLRRKGRMITHCHQLIVGVWRGIFLVDPKGEFVVGLLFSKEPHRLDDRLDELVRRHATAEDVVELRDAGGRRVVDAGTTQERIGILQTALATMIDSQRLERSTPRGPARSEP